MTPQILEATESPSGDAKSARWFPPLAMTQNLLTIIQNPSGATASVCWLPPLTMTVQLEVTLNHTVPFR